MPSEFLPHMLDAVADGGKIALDLLENSSPTLKADFSVLTKADLAVSALIRQRLARFLDQPEHILIDEEDPQSGRYFNSQILEKSPYLWMMDPIDGTRAFANRMPLFGISLGLLKELRPWLGVIYFPVLRELFYCDGTAAYFVKNAFTPEEQRILIQPVDQTITRQSVFFGNDVLFKEYDSHIQRGSATLALKTSEGVAKFKHFRGRLLSKFSMRLISLTVTLVKSVFLGTYRRMSPMTCSTEPFSQLW